MSMTKRESLRLERRANIIAVARELFLEHGYAGTNMSAIAARLGGSKGTLWSYFPSKEALFAAMIEDTTAAVRSQIDINFKPGDYLENLVRLCRSVIDRGVSPLGLAIFRVINAEGARQPEVGRIFYERGPKRTQEMIGAYLEKAFGHILRKTDFVKAGMVLVTLCTSGSYYEQLWGVAPPATSRQKDADARLAAEIFLRAYALEPEKWLGESVLGPKVVEAA